jgi:uncharacterized protein (DUF433 family)
MENLQAYIEVQDGVRSGKAVFVATRITVADVLEMLGAGMDEHEILEDFPSLTRNHILAALQYAAQRERSTSYMAA